MNVVMCNTNKWALQLSSFPAVAKEYRHNMEDLA